MPLEGRRIISRLHHFSYHTTHAYRELYLFRQNTITSRLFGLATQPALSYQYVHKYSQATEYTTYFRRRWR
jgi:hypothetical protein